MHMDRSIRMLLYILTKCKQLNTPLSKIIEQFVELNHQMGKRIDEQSKRIVCATTMANSMAKRKALEYHSAVRKRIKLVHDDASRGTYEKKTPEQQLTSPVRNSNLPMPNGNQPRPATQVTPTMVEKKVRVDGGTICIREMSSF